ncbi:MAG: branched-chain amino acid ABC transporter permease [Alphaproteobacteria bacterium]|nr:branched-chain amino acid ABC transporter permease [Alphaproteobacteria bacterium]|tara:strand:- start:292 stop:1245 length:954 start_codon:yes stop_codon:yes gene_type:complete
MDALRNPTNILSAIVIGLCAIVPFAAPAVGEPFYVIVFARIMIWAIAAVSLNLIMGYGGMISFGHAVYLGVGGYTIGILAFHGVTSAWIQWPLAIGACALISLIFGAISLRTRGVYFIMITLALAQMIFFLSVSAERYGSDDGLNILTRSDFGVEFYDLNHKLTMYYTIFAVLVASVFVSWRLVNSRFGLVMRGAKSNDTRVQAVGVSTYLYRLSAFVIAGVMCGIAGLLQANLENFVSPDMMDWRRSGELIFMVVLGGMSTLFGPVTGAFVFLMLSEVLASITHHWHIIFGPFLVLVVLFARGGIAGLLTPRSARE